MKSLDLTEKEKEILTKLAEVHNLYTKLGEEHPSDINEWVLSLHRLQQLIGIRVARRNNPEMWYKHTIENK
jgi:hypothetical protein